VFLESENTNLVRKVIFRILLLTMFFPVTGQGQGILSGVVKDFATRAAIEMVNVGVVGGPEGTATDTKGRYRLALNRDDSVTVRFSFTGYESQEYRMALHDGEKVTLDVTLRASAKRLDAINIHEEKNRQSTFTQLDVKRLEDAVGPAGGVEALVKMLPDVSSNNELSSQYSVRGGSFDENLVYINGVELFRPMLIRNAQQEGMSIINPDLVDYILFSPGGFEALYGDKLSSVLDITYSRPTERKGKVSASLLGASATLQGMAGERISYAVGGRWNSNKYVLGSMDTKGQYTTRYMDIQALFNLKVNEKMDVGVMLIGTDNVYGLVPLDQKTSFGGFELPLQLNIYFDGQEQDRYHTVLGAVTMDYRPNDDWQMKGALAVQHVNESEKYDVQSQYWLYELGMGEDAGDTTMFDRGVGTFLEHARNRLVTDMYTVDVKATRQARLGEWRLGLKLQMENITDHLREWKWVDSAGYSLPYVPTVPGDTTVGPVPPMLQQYICADNDLRTWRGAVFVQRELNFETRRHNEIKVLLGVRGHVYNSSDGQATTGWQKMISPRVSVNYKPHWEKDMLFRIAAGIYQQTPFYREYRDVNGVLNLNVGPQKSYQLMGTWDWNMQVWGKPFKLTADLYYKYLTNLIPYTIDNLRLRYMPELSAVGYATGLSLRINGELVEGLESWASLSLMRTQEDIEGDGLGWLDRPTDQRFSFKIFLQDKIPTMPWWKMSLSMIVGTGMPVTVPNRIRTAETFRLPPYYRVDWGNSVLLSKVEALKHARIFRYVDDIQLGVDLFNMFNFRNVISYLWVSDYQNNYYPVPNYLTARQINVKLTVLF